MEDRYSRNAAAFSVQELEAIRRKKVLVVGCGGLGGHVIQSLARFGVGRLTLVDGDSFIPSNLNRQVFATDRTLGQSKALAAAEALTAINPEVETRAHPVFLTEENAAWFVGGQDIALDCLDNLPARFLLARACDREGVPLVHGAVGGFCGQVANLFPGENFLGRIYPQGTDPGASVEKTLGAPPFAPQLVAALQVCEALKILAGRAEILRGSVLHVDMLLGRFTVIPLV